MRRLDFLCGCWATNEVQGDLGILDFGFCDRHHATHLGDEPYERPDGTYPVVPGCACPSCEADGDTCEEDWDNLTALREDGFG